jgi:hypothetical protein
MEHPLGNNSPCSFLKSDCKNDCLSICIEIQISSFSFFKCFFRGWWSPLRHLVIPLQSATLLRSDTVCSRSSGNQTLLFPSLLLAARIWDPPAAKNAYKLPWTKERRIFRKKSKEARRRGFNRD